MAGGVTDTVLMWNAGKEAAQGVWTADLVGGPRQRLDQELRLRKYRAKYGLPPENQAWGDYTSLKVIGRGHQDGRHHRQQESGRGPGEDQVRRRQGPGAVLTAPRTTSSCSRCTWPDQEDRQTRTSGISSTSWPRCRARTKSLEVIAPTKEENPCNMKRSPDLPGRDPLPPFSYPSARSLERAESCCPYRDAGARVAPRSGRSIARIVTDTMFRGIPYGIDDIFPVLHQRHRAGSDLRPPGHRTLDHLRDDRHREPGPRHPLHAGGLRQW